MSEAPTIAVTGLGVLGAAGAGRNALLATLREAEPRLAEVDRRPDDRRESAARRAALVGAINTRDWIPPLIARRMSLPSRFAVVAGRLALDNAGLEPGADSREDVGVAIATAFGPADYTQRLLDQILGGGPAAASPALFTECVANAPAARISLQFKLQGPTHTLSAREAGALMAVGRGAADVRDGRVGRALCGTVEEMTPLLHAILDRFDALAHAGDGRPERARPFDRHRSGYLAAEGAAVAVLEPLAAARERRAGVLAIVRGWGSGFDASATRAGWGRGSESLARSLRRCLDRAGVDPGAIDLVVSGASGSRAGDRLEALTLQAAWRGRNLPPVIAPKGVTGEYGGGFLAAALLAAGGEEFPGRPGFAEVDPELALVPDDGSAIRRARTVLVTSLAPGGAASWLVLERP